MNYIEKEDWREDLVHTICILTRNFISSQFSFLSLITILLIVFTQPVVYSQYNFIYFLYLCRIDGDFFVAFTVFVFCFPLFLLNNLIFSKIVIVSFKKFIPRFYSDTKTIFFFCINFKFLSFLISSFFLFKPYLCFFALFFFFYSYKSTQSDFFFCFCFFSGDFLFICRTKS